MTRKPTTASLRIADRHFADAECAPSDEYERACEYADRYGFPHPSRTLNRNEFMTWNRHAQNKASFIRREQFRGGAA